MARHANTKGFQIPTPGHPPVKVKFCGNDYDFVMPSRLKADALRGYLLAAISKMAQPLQETVMKMAHDIAASSDIEVQAARSESDMTENQKIAFAAGTYMAIEEVFEFVCRALCLTARERAYAEDHYEQAEMMRAFVTLQGCLMRPFGGTKKDFQEMQNPQMTASENGANGML